MSGSPTTRPVGRHEAVDAGPDPSGHDRAPDATRPGRWRRWVLVASVVLMAAGVLAMLAPAVAAPLIADQRYMYLEVAGRTPDGWHQVVTEPLSEAKGRLGAGRLTTLGLVVQWAAYRGIADTAVQTGIPIVALHGAQKVPLFGLSVWAVVALARSLRARTRDGPLTRLSGRSMVLLAAGMTVVGAAGVQAQKQFANGWTTYPVLTYGAVIACFGSAAVALALTRWYARSPRLPVAAVLVLALTVLGVALNLGYELYLVAYPAAVLAVLAQPLAEGSTSRPLRAKVLATLTLTVSTVGTFGLIRRAAAACAEPGSYCYTGTSLDLGRETVALFRTNLVSSLPGTGRGQVDRQLAELGYTGLGDLPGPSPTLLVIVAVGALAGLVLLAAVRSAEPAADVAPASGPALRPQLTMLALLAVIGVGVAVGSALMMSVSERAPDMVQAVGDPYRHTMVSWLGLCLVVICVVLALDLALGRVVRPLRWLPWVALAAALAVVVSLVMPANLAASRAESLTPYSQTIAAVNRELVLADLTPEGDRRRCESLQAVGRNVPSAQTIRFLANALTRAWERYNGQQPYCSDDDLNTKYLE
ncbi:MAG: hypothetical protein GEU96_04710 [Propionibacteriales bacterium]|nr:hypothetical protein [Propionibacteriales bacterium]